MFVFSQYITEAYKRKVEEYEEMISRKARESNYYDERDFRRKYASPKQKIINVLRYVVAGIALFLFLVYIISSINVSIENNNKAYEQAMVGKNCQAHNLNDHVRITSGTYNNNNGVIIGGCEKSSDYQVKLDKGSEADIPDDGKDKIDVGGKTVGVGSYKDLTVIKGDQDGTSTDK